MKHPLEAFVSNPRGAAICLRGGRPAWSTAVGLGPIPYRFAGSNPASRTPMLTRLIQVRDTVSRKFFRISRRCSLESYHPSNRFATWVATTTFTNHAVRIRVIDKTSSTTTIHSLTSATTSTGFRQNSSMTTTTMTVSSSSSSSSITSWAITCYCLALSSAHGHQTGSQVIKTEKYSSNIDFINSRKVK